MSGNQPAPDGVMRLINGYWATAVLGAAAEHSLFTYLEQGVDTAAALAARAELSERGVQALLDGLVATDLVTVEQGRYRNTPQASAYLVEGLPGCLSGIAKLKIRQMSGLSGLSEVVRAGGPAGAATEVAGNPHWGEVVPAIAAQSVPAAEVAAEVLGLADAGEVSILDVGGGSGIYSAIWLEANPAARATQLDWEPINAIARKLLDERGVGERFTCIDGDFHTTDFGIAQYDVVLYSHIAHQEGPQANTEVFGRLRKALKPGGAAVICDYVVDDDRSGPAFPLIFAAEMLLKSKQGGTWRRAEYRDWLLEAGFSEVSFHSAPPATVVVAR